MKNKILKTMVAIGLSLITLISLSACGMEFETNKGSETINNESSSQNTPSSTSNNSEEASKLTATLGNDVKIGGSVTLGSYEQDNDLSTNSESIEWLVLDIQDGKALLISKYALDAQPFNTEGTNVTWETCTLRTWLNNDFYNKAFTDVEKEVINTTKVVAESNPSDDFKSNDPGNDTQDKVFVLSYNEAYKYFNSDSERHCKPTTYADERGAYVYAYDSFKGNTYWWLRNPGAYNRDALFVHSSGNSGFTGAGVHTTFYTVRPAMWINIV